MKKSEVVNENLTFVVIISADIEWQVVRDLFRQGDICTSPYGEWMDTQLEIKGTHQKVTFFQGGWGKIAAAASAQYVIDHWAPDLLLNLGTCGGFEGQINKGSIILVEKTIVYDILEQMVDLGEPLAHYTTNLNLSWLTDDYPEEVVRTLLISADRDLVPEEIDSLKHKFNAVAGDWESGAIAFVAKRNGTKCLILRGVTDIVGSSGGEAYGDVQAFIRSTKDILEQLVKTLPDWLALF